jgi:hypothetical protein
MRKSTSQKQRLQLVHQTIRALTTSTLTQVNGGLGVCVGGAACVTTRQYHDDDVTARDWW